MSNKLLTAVWDHGPDDRTALMVLLALADQASDEGLCWPSVGTIARRSRLTDRGVQKVLRRLELSGWLTTIVRPGRSNAYNLAPPNAVHPEPETPRTGVHPTPEPGFTPPPNGGSPKPLENPKGTKERTTAGRRAVRLTDDFTLPDDWIEYAESKGLSRDQAIDLGEAMRDWSMAASGSRGAKLDWLAAWRGFVRSEVKSNKSATGKSYAERNQKNSENRIDAFLSGARA